MKLATLKNGTRDGKLVVVSKDLTRFTDASFLMPTLQAALDDWQRIAPHLAAMAESLETGAVPSSRFHEHDAHAPLPRCYGWAGGSGSFTPPRDPILVSGDHIDLGAEIAVIVDDLPAGATLQQARDAIRLIVLVNSVSLPSSAAGQPGFETHPSAAFSPVAVTPDELDEAWDGAKVALPLHVEVNGKAVARSGAASDFAALIVAAARARPLTAGTIVSRSTGNDTLPARAGDTVRLEMKDRGGHSIFGAIEQRVEKG